MAKSIENFFKKAEKMSQPEHLLPDSLPTVSMSSMTDAIRFEADVAGPLDVSVKESVDDSVPRRRALGAKVLRVLYGEMDFGELTEHMAGSAVDAFRAKNAVKGMIAIEQLYMAIEKRRGEDKKPEGNSEEQLQDPARRAAGDAALENVAWAAGKLRIVAGTDFEAKKAKEQADDKLAG